jgi:hypothetical protein
MKILFTAILSAALLLFICVSVVAVAQRSSPYKVSEEQVRELLRQLEDRADSYRSLVDIVLEVSRLDGTPREERLDLLVAEFEREVDAFKERFSKDASTATDVERVLRAAVRVDGPLMRAIADQSLHPDASLRERGRRPSGRCSNQVSATLPTSTILSGSGVVHLRALAIKKAPRSKRAPRSPPAARESIP